MTSRKKSSCFMAANVTETVVGLRLRPQYVTKKIF